MRCMPCVLSRCVHVPGAQGRVWVGAYPLGHGLPCGRLGGQPSRARSESRVLVKYHGSVLLLRVTSSLIPPHWISTPPSYFPIFELFISSAERATREKGSEPVRLDGALHGQTMYKASTHAHGCPPTSAWKAPSPWPPFGVPPAATFC